MSTLVYVFWILIPSGILLLAIWDYIDNKTRKRKDRHSINLMKQAIFVIGCVICCMLIDKFLLDVIVESVLMGLVSRDLMLVLLLPIILVAASIIIGPSKQIMIADGAKRKK